MKNNKGFTLVEVLIGISISIILMLSVSAFIVSGIKNITIQKNILSNSISFQETYSDLNNIFSSKELTLNLSTSSGFLLKTSNTLGNGFFSYIGVKSESGFCLSENAEDTYHLKILNFTPFERNGFDIFASKSFSGDIVYGSGNDMYVSDPSNHVVYFGDKTNFNSTKQIIVGNGVFGNKIGNNGTSTYLNNPTGLAFGEGKLFISDTGNNRILYLSGSSVYTLLDIYDGIFEPTGIVYNSGTLYISNSGKNEILAYKNDNSIKDNFSYDFELSSAINSISKIGVSVYDYRGADISVSAPTSSGSFTFSGFLKNTGDSVSILGNTINYTFSGAKNLSAGNYGISVSNISGSFLNNGSYYLKILIDGSPQKTFYLPFFTKGDSFITTDKSNNILKTITGSLSGYPTGLYFAGSNLEFRDFLNRKYFEIDLNGNLVNTGNLTAFDFEGLNWDNTVYKKSAFPVKNFDFNTNSGLLNLKVDYYKNYDCEDSSYDIVKSMLFKVNYKN